MDGTLLGHVSLLPRQIIPEVRKPEFGAALAHSHVYFINKSSLAYFSITFIKIGYGILCYLYGFFHITKSFCSS